MVVVTIGLSSRPIRFGDHITAGNGVYEVYLNGQYVPARRTNIAIAEYEAALLNDSVTVGTVRYAFTVKNNSFKNYVVGVLSNWEKLCTAFQYWADNNSVLYYTQKNKAGYNIRQWPKADYSAMETLTVNLKDLIELPPPADGPTSEFYQMFDCVFKRTNPADLVP